MVLIPVFNNIIIADEINNNLKQIDYLFKNRLFSDVIIKLNLNFFTTKSTLSKNYFQYDTEYENRLNYYYGVSFFFLKKYDKAFFYLKKVKNPYYRLYFDPVNFYLGTIYFIRDNFEKSFDYYNSLIERTDIIKDKLNYYYNFSVSSLKSNNKKLAIMLLKDGIDYIKTNMQNSKKISYYLPFYIFTLARVYYLDNQLENALIEFNKIVNNYSTFELADDSLFFRGKIFFILKKYKNAKTQFIKLIENYKKSNYYYNALFYLGEITGNKLYYKMIIDNFPDFEDIDFVLYNYANITNDIESFKKVLKISKNKDLIYNSLVKLISLINKNSKDNSNNSNFQILELIRANILKSSKKNELLDYALNLLYITSRVIDSNDFKKSENYLHYFENLQNNISFSDREFYILGKIYFNKSKFKKSIFYLNKAVNINHLQKYFYYLGISYYNDDNLNQAFENLEKARLFKNGKSNFKLLSDNYIGLIYLKKSKYNEALKIFDSLLRVSAPYISIKQLKYYKLICLYNLKKFTKALDLIRDIMNGFKLNSQLDYQILTYILKILPNIDIEYANALYSIYGSIVDKQFNIAFYLSEKYFSINNYKRSLMYLDYIYNKGNNKNKIDALIKKYLLLINIRNYQKADEVIKVAYNISNSVNNNNYKKSLILRYLIVSSIKMIENKYKANYKNKVVINEEVQKKIENYFSNLKELGDNENLIISAKTIYLFYNRYKYYSKALKYLNDIIKLSEISLSGNNKQNLSELYFQKVLLLYNLKKFNQCLSSIDNLLNLYSKVNDNNDKLFAKKNTLKQIKFDILLHLKDIENIKNYLFNEIKIEKNSDNLYYLLINYIILYEINVIKISDLLSIENILKNKNIEYIYIIFKMLKEFNNKYSFKEFNKIFSEFLNYKNERVNFWAKFFYSLYFYNEKDYKNSTKILEALLKYDYKYETQLILYYLILIEKKNNKQKKDKYWNIFLRDYKNSLIYLIKY